MDTPKADLATYKNYLTSIGSPTDDAKADPYRTQGEWRFFLRSTTPGDKRDPAAISASGDVVSERAKGRWHKFLSQKDATPEALAAHVLWLLGASSVADKDTTSDKQAKKLITPPQLTREAADTVRLTFWQITPPNMNSPFQVVVTAAPGKDVIILSTHWKELTKKR